MLNAKYNKTWATRCWSAVLLLPHSKWDLGMITWLDGQILFYPQVTMCLPGDGLRRYLGCFTPFAVQICATMTVSFCHGEQHRRFTSKRS